jgi:fucose permease
LAVGGTAAVLAGLYSATRPPLAALIVVQVVSGYGGGVSESVLNAFLTTLPGATTLLNRLHAFFGTGALLGPLLATWILGFARWPTVWLVLGLAGVPLTLAFLLIFPPRAPASPTRSEEVAAPRNSLLGAALRRPGVVLGAVLLAAYVGLEISLGNWGFSYLVEQRGQSGLLAGYTVSGFWLGLTLGRFVLSPVAARLGLTAVGLIMACLSAVAVFAMVVWLVPAAVAASAGFALLGFFLGPIFPTTMAVAPTLSEPRLVPTAIGIMNAGSVIGGSVLPWLAGILAQQSGAWTLLPFVLALAGAQLVLCGWLVRAGRA